MNYAKIKPVDIANGPGVRVSVFVSGCSHHCKGCFNQEAWDYNAGEKFSFKTVLDIIELCDKPQIAGLSILGGEPLDPKNRYDVMLLAAAFKFAFPEKTIWCYTGYLWEEVKHLPIMKYIDVLVDGRFVESLKNLSLKFRGSSNQRIIDVKESVNSGCIVLKEV